MGLKVTQASQLASLLHKQGECLMQQIRQERAWENTHLHSVLSYLDRPHVPFKPAILTVPC